MKIKQNIFIIILLLNISIYGCQGNSTGNNSSENQPALNENSDSSLMGSPVLSVDVTAKSESKGVGKFTHVKIGVINPIMASKGKILFQSKCAVCHKATSEKLIGPGLKGITKIRTPEWIMNMLTNSSGMTDKDSVAEALLDQYHTQMVVQVTDDEARNILEYLRQNDSAY